MQDGSFPLKIIRKLTENDEFLNFARRWNLESQGESGKSRRTEKPDKNQNTAPGARGRMDRTPKWMWDVGAFGDEVIGFQDLPSESLFVSMLVELRKKKSCALKLKRREQETERGQDGTATEDRWKQASSPTVCFCLVLLNP